MSSWPWFPFYVDDFLASPKVRRMSAGEVGTYVLLLCEQWQVGYVADDDMEELARMVKSKPAVVEKLLNSCFERAAPGWVNAKLDSFREGQDAKSEQAKAAAMARWRGKHDADAMRTDMRTQCESYPEPEPEPEEEPHSSERFEEVWSVARRGSKRQAIHQYRRAVPSKVSHEALLAAWKAHVSAASGEQYVAHLFRWIRDERWEEEVPKTVEDREAAEWREKKAATEARLREDAERLTRAANQRNGAPPTKANEPSGPLAGHITRILEAAS